MVVKPRALVLTGSTGFLGFNLAKLIHAQNQYKLICFVHKKSEKNQKLNELNGTILVEEISELLSLSTEFQIEHIVHTATDYGRKLKLKNNLLENEDFANLIRVNLLLPIELMQAGEKLGISSFINIDSYFNKTGQTYQALPEYAASKQSLIPWLKTFAKKFQIINLQLEHIFGPGDSIEKFIPTLIKDLRENKDVSLTKGEQIRDFIYVKDVCSAIMQVLGKSIEVNPKNAYSEYSIGTGIGTTIQSFVIMIKNLVSSNSKLLFGAIPYRPDEIQDSHSDCQFQRDYDWRPQSGLEQSLREYLDHD